MWRMCSSQDAVLFSHQLPSCLRRAGCNSKTDFHLEMGPTVLYGSIAVEEEGKNALRMSFFVTPVKSQPTERPHLSHCHHGNYHACWRGCGKRSPTNPRAL